MLQTQHPRPASTIALLICLAAGCGSNTDQSPEALNARYEAAVKISDVGKRDDALSAVASQAASAGQADIVKKAVGNMSDVGKRDRAARGSALALSKAGKKTEAVEVAKGISDVGKRDAVLSQLAKN